MAAAAGLLGALDFRLPQAARAARAVQQRVAQAAFRALLAFT